MKLTLLVAVNKNSLVPSLAGVEINPTTPIFTPAIDNISLQDAVNEAWQKRPELQQANLNLANADIEVKATKNALLPVVNPASVSTQRRGPEVCVKDDRGDSNGCAFGGTTDRLTPAAQEQKIHRLCQESLPLPRRLLLRFSSFRVAFGDDWSRLFASKYPGIYQGGFNITLPIRNRAAQAGLAPQHCLIRSLQDTQYRQTQNTILTGRSGNSLIALAQDRAAVKAAAEARTLNQQS